MEESKKRDKYSWIFLFPLLLFFASGFASAQHWDGVVVTQSDFQALNAIKHELIDFKGVLKSWNDSSSGACSGDWVGIKCVNGQVIAIQLPWKGLGGRISERIGQLQALRRISLHDNVLAGTVPYSLGFLPNLRGVYLFNNRLSGSIPPSIGHCPVLQTLDLSNNQLTGTIPPSLANSTKLYRLNLSFNSIMGSIPVSLTQSSSLTFLALQHNNLSGSVPDSWGGSETTEKKIYQLQILTLDHNLLSGMIPSSLSKLGSLEMLNLSENSINGSFPASLTNLSSLVSLNLGSNHLNNQIPETIDRLQNLSVLILKNNQFNGQIPETIGNISTITVLDLSNNNFTSKIPNSLANYPTLLISMFPTTIFLALFLLSSPKPSIQALLPGICSFVGIVPRVHVLLPRLKCCLHLHPQRKKVIGKKNNGKKAGGQPAGGGEKAVPSETGAEVESGGEAGGKLVHFDGPFVFGADDLLCATAEIMGKSPYGTVYKATLEDGNEVAVKRLREKVAKGQKEFESEVVALGKIRHPNVLALRAYYLGPKGEKLLVFDHMPNGSLATFLHDVGLSRLMTNAANTNALATAGSLGYNAPELSKLKNANTKTDVYSLGVIILELLTGKSPSEATDGGDLPQWVASIVKEEWTNEVFDVELMRDGSNSGDDELLNTLKLALHCVDPSPSARPEAEQVLQQLEGIKDSSKTD
ncbi:hypothetical protein HYC85_022194 [Camellia sinensis]|uniref:Protein kinase domain-containing protein n=1 Tax=Camellia sinensis TaxID=4442 RepID=A0A7J7GKK4_CAMSI|nr:hypothetical protein HYC85_022194 [Camellia sinensis]